MTTSTFVAVLITCTTARLRSVMYAKIANCGRPRGVAVAVAVGDGPSEVAVAVGVAHAQHPVTSPVDDSQWRTSPCGQVSGF